MNRLLPLASLTSPFLIFTSALAFIGCSSSESTPRDKSQEVPDSGTSPDAMDTADSPSSSTQDDSSAQPRVGCVAKGAHNNEKGVGGYCEKGKNDCTGNGGLFFCSADFDADEGAWFCTTLCSKDADCGSGAFCQATSQGAGCVPNACGADAGR